MSSQVLVTGAAGFIGSHVSRHLLKQGHPVVGLDDLSGGFRDYVPPGVKFVEGSVADATLVKQLFAEHQFDCVFHLAAYAAARSDPASAKSALRADVKMNELLWKQLSNQITLFMDTITLADLPFLHLSGLHAERPGPAGLRPAPALRGAGLRLAW